MTDTTRSVDDLSPARVTTAFDLPGHTTVRSLGVAQGIIVRSRSIVGSFGASLQTIFGGNITLYTSLCEKARQQAFDKMLADARKLGANAVVAMRYDSTEIGSGVTEVICYGTAVRVTQDV
ncbi:YbjQ family protein [Burkholderia sp. DN3021]|uniref:YbjQ family protein n=1 Tax=Burkholderia sp. DN3021 TaxID=3410137 RepID=UPI003C7C40F3